MSAVGASHVDAVFDFDAAVGVELVDFVEGYAEDEVHEDVQNAKRSSSLLMVFSSRKD